MNNIASRLFDKSMAFLEGAIVTSKASDSFIFKTSEYSNVTAHLLHHAIELFLKFAIVSYTKKLPENEHKIFKLYEEYEILYPNKEFEIKIPFVEKPKYKGFSEKEIENHKIAFPMSIELQLRYPVGWQEEAYSPISKFETSYLESCKEQFLQLRCKILPCEKA